jgi:hypothetical protein
MVVGRIANLEHTGVATLNLGGRRSAMSEAFELAMGGSGPCNLRVGVKMGNGETIADERAPDLSCDAILHHFESQQPWLN